MKPARYRTVVREFEHAERVMDKKRRVEVLRALLEMHQQQHEHDQYTKGLRQRLKRKQTYLRTCGHSDADGKIARYFSLDAGTISLRRG